nr:hypothetical protein [Tanacetum cinerariifolium]
MEEVMEMYATVSDETKKWIDAEVGAVQIILTRIDNDIYSIVDACPNKMKMWKAIERLKQVVDDEASSKEKKINKIMALISISFKKIYKPTCNNLRTSSNTKNMNVDNTQRSDRRSGHDRHTGRYDNQRAANVAEARENMGTQVVQQTGIQCFNCKEFEHVARECKKAKQA